MTELLLQRIARGDATAIGPCIQKYGTLLWTLARNATHSEAEAEDAVQVIFLELWRSAGEYDAGKEPEMNYVSTVARNRLEGGSDAADEEEAPDSDDSGDMAVTIQMDEPLPQHLADHLEEQAQALMQPATAVPQQRDPAYSFPAQRGDTLPPPAMAVALPEVSLQSAPAMPEAPAPPEGLALSSQEELTKVSASPLPASRPEWPRPLARVEHTELIVLPIRDDKKQPAKARSDRKTVMLPPMEGPPPPPPADEHPEVPPTIPGTGVLPGARPAAPPRPVAPPPPKSSALPWSLAFACLLVAVVVVVWTMTAPTTQAVKSFGGAPEISVTVPSPSADEQRERFIEESGKKPVSWVKTNDEAALGASGDVVWDNKKQVGYLRFNGLPANTPAKLQYQLFIFDETRRYPVDGGVFDIPDKAGDLVVKISPKLRVGKPQLFAVSLEKPGGVVVSQRERVVLTARIR